MSSESDDSDKSHEPTPKKLQDARKKGEIIRSADVSVAASYAGLWLGLLAFGALWVQSLGGVLTVFLSRADDLANRFVQDPASQSIGSILQDTVPGLFGWAALPATLVLASLAAQRGFAFAPSKLAFKAQRLSPLSNAKNKFGRRGLFEFVKSFAKLLLYSLCLAVFLRANLDRLTGSLLLEPRQVVMVMGQVMLELLAVITGIATALAVLDYMWQRADFLRRNRMSHKELRDEQKEAEGDPTMKAQRRAKAQAIASNRMMADVPGAEVVIVNPTHFAVALRWDRTPGSAPVCVAKGVDEMALKIREIATDAGVPIHSDPPTARAIYATVEIGEQIAPDHYGPVALAIRFAEELRQRARRGW
ncbi:flagellar type III secretion system protein FlhB [Mesobacterium sp. TK19101]|uniref:Flagellar type III secretion system protein FlhB n=1 Tax=Mesobacterium hydrothermale TaxID=3111907 RepID=A0ABU6HFX0_9RHOB|nr:flagellar type III secretion system protein FlhB [Mesobacterium sp. TK19101]MEC3861360.1 flagellar type III secretion system protein FlhB [Mesobacterium sp. TK19101]